LFDLGVLKWRVKLSSPGTCIQAPPQLPPHTTVLFDGQNDPNLSFSSTDETLVAGTALRSSLANGAKTGEYLYVFGTGGFGARVGCQGSILAGTATYLVHHIRLLRCPDLSDNSPIVAPFHCCNHSRSAIAWTVSPNAEFKKRSGMNWPRNPLFRRAKPKRI
jgi:hypothetical protein